LRSGNCSLSVAEAAAKLPPTQLSMLMTQFVEEGRDRLGMQDIHAIKEVRLRSAVEALPPALFTDDFGDAASNDGYSAMDDPPKKFYRFTGRLWETLQALEQSGALIHKNNRLSRRACREARELIAEMKGNQEEDD
jgi:hypothetical protein